ncbi:hypothetical protein CGCF415_v001409 [Colletotrichum fructicola]|uniref:RING-type domain-containing protein n=1 Tax=Colletotrichum fructicola (strain Nara gc5) TaxID=1213859 RepID=A0A7J6JS13_COLFN|nr:uncharacterized protein CGMCC3_g9387 [Colletotrichum fructicola]KAF4492881.1 hypothetical protein CGGC5_v000429 [Colletotrichum fructicola Nara gc5]KAE9574629.1 hypothetical protein CGMCC3_g9387 [Colletotrichum fructicola]KAF4432899.1 hypothetical protein CFRS1_v007821 [Colletotrichum fructicola]KAF4899098.1 hypothetical protein CGCFRS4_v003953 [Colletotrichum fructicola]KAF4915558.1 hypothetical protein CGCF415_v001409 [Colletotrichum fructicola]
MCILKHIFYQCPETEESREAKQEHPDNNILDLPNKKVKLYRRIGDLDACVRLRAGEEHHMQQVRVYCAHPFIGNCRQPTGKVVEIVQGMCADCLSVSSALPRKAWLRQEQQLSRDVTERNPEQERKMMENKASAFGLKTANEKDKQNDGEEDGSGGPVLRGAPYTDVHPDLFQYFQQVVILLKHSVARKIPEANMREDDLKQVRMEIRAERFCRRDDKHCMDDPNGGAAARMAICKCTNERIPMCANVGRALRMSEAQRILEHHSRMVNLLEANYKSTDSRHLQEQRTAARRFFLDRRGARADVEETAVYDMYPSEKPRYLNAIMALNNEVKDKIKQVRQEQLWIETDAEWSEFERQLRMRVLVAAPAIVWIALDNGLKDEVAEELIGIAVTWFLYVGSIFDPIHSYVHGMHPDKTDQQKAAEVAVYNDIKRMFSVVTQMFPASDLERWQVFHSKFPDGEIAVEGRRFSLEVRRAFHDRDTYYANAIRKVPDALAATRKRVISVATATARLTGNHHPAPQQPQADQSTSDESTNLIEFEDAAAKEKEDPPICGICKDPYDDNNELLRAVAICPQSNLHLLCFRCTMAHVLWIREVNTTEKGKEDKMPECPACREDFHGEFFRIRYKDLGTLGQPSVEDGEDAVRGALIYPPSDAVRPGQPFLW